MALLDPRVAAVGASSGAKPIRLSNRFAHGLVGALAATTPSTAHQTWCSKHVLAQKALRVRVHLFNQQATAVNIAGIVIARTDNKDMTTGGAITWQPQASGATVSGKDLAGLDGWKTVATAVQQTARTGVRAMGFYSSPWTEVDAECLLVRVQMNGGSGNAYSWRGMGAAAANFRTSSLNAGRPSCWGTLSGDQTSAPTNNPTSFNGNALLMVLEYEGLASGITLMTIGDSIDHNSGLVADVLSSYGWRAATRASLPNCPIEYVNAGVSGFNSQNYWESGKVMLNLLKPNAPTFAPFSPNDEPFADAAATRTKLLEMRRRTFEFLESCRDLQSTGFLRGPLPYPAGLTAALDPLRRAWATELRAAVRPDLFVDTGFVGDGATGVEGFAAPWSFNDNIHWNEAAIDVAGRQLASLLARLS